MHAQQILARLLCFAVGYVFGSFLTAEVVCHAVAGKSAREIGSGNPGMANVLQHVGKGAGLIVLAGDLLKTAAACGVGYWAAGPVLGSAAVLYAGFGAILGHNYPFWARTRGGKGVAVTCGWLILYMPLAGTLCCLAGGALVLWLGFLPLGAVVIPLAAILPAWLLHGPESAVIMSAAAGIMLIRHRHGLQRIRKGTEPRFFRHPS